MCSCLQRVKNDLKHECIVDSVKESERYRDRHVAKRTAIVVWPFILSFNNLVRLRASLLGFYLKDGDVVKADMD